LDAVQLLGSSSLLYLKHMNMNLDRSDLHGLLLVRDGLDADGGFIIAHLLKLLLGLDGEHNVIMVACKHTSSHYASVMRKMGLNVGLLAQAERFVLLDSLRGLAHHPSKFVDLKALQTTLESASWGKGEGGPPVCIIFDDLMVIAERFVGLSVIASVSIYPFPDVTSRPCNPLLSLMCRL